MKRTILINLLLITILLVSCSPTTGGPTATNRPPQVGVTPAPNVESSMQVFMDAWMLENGEWKILWDDGLILPELQGGNKLQVDYRTPARGDIYDSAGNAIVTQADAVSLGFIPAQVNPETSGTLFFLLEQLTGVKAGNT